MRQRKRETTFCEVEAILKENAEEIYAAAYAKAGEASSAMAVMEDAMLYGIKRSVELVSKHRIMEIILERIGICAGDGIALIPKDELDTVIDGALARARAWHRRKRILTRLGVGFIVLAVCLGVALPFLPKDIVSQSKSVLLMENALVIKGDNDRSELVNYQHISENLPMHEAHLRASAGHSRMQHVLASVTAPDGTPYAVINNLETVDGNDTTFTLYRGYRDGWEPVATEVHGANIDHTKDFCISELFLYADRESDIYVFNRVGTDVHIYKYDRDMETFEKKQSFPFKVISFYFTMHVAWDMEQGEKGVAYIACNWAGSVKLWRYDVATDTLSVILENIEMPTSIMQLDMAARNDLVYLTCSNGSKQLTLYRIASDGTVESLVVYDGREHVLDIAVDQSGTVHMIGVRDTCTYYRISADLTVSQAPLERSYYRDTDHSRFLLGLFIGKDGGVYVVETYKDGKGGEACFLAYARVDGENVGDVSFVNGFDMLDNYEGNFARVNGTDVSFPTYAYFDENTVYFVYFHISEIGGES